MSVQAFCTDEDVAVRLPGDFVTLCPAWQSLAYGEDGAITAGAWALTSATINFATNVVAAGNVIHVKGTPFKGTGELFAVVSVSSGTCNIRRIGLSAATGAAPVTSSATALTFSVKTFYPQIEDASDELCRRFGIDENITITKQSQLYDRRELRQACVLIVLRRMLQTMVRTDEGDWMLKLKGVTDELSETLARIQLRWGSTGHDRPPGTRFSTRLGR